MTRNAAIAMFVVCAVVLGGSVMFLTSGGSAGVTPQSPEAMVRRAESVVPKPVPPQPVTGHVEAQARSVELAVPVPQARTTGLAVRTPATQIIQHRVELPSLVGAPPPETSTWEKQQADYVKALQDEIDRLASQQRAGTASKSGETSAQIAAMITAIAGLVGSIASLLAVLKNSPKKPA